MNDLYFLAEKIAQLSNPQLFYDLKNAPDLERIVAVEDLKSIMEEELRLKIFEDWRISCDHS